MEGKDGLIGDNPIKMSEAILAILSNQKKYNEMVAYIQNERKLQNDWTQICRSFIAVYENENINIKKKEIC